MGTLALLAALGAADVRRHDLMVRVLIWGHVISVVALMTFFIFGRTTAELVVFGRQVSMGIVLLGAVAMDGGILVALVLLYRSAVRARHGLLFFAPVHYRALCALADVVVAGEEEVISPERIASRVDRYLAAFRARRKWLMKAALLGLEFYPLLSFHAPLSVLSHSSRRRFVRDRFYRDVARRTLRGLWRRLVQGMIRLGLQLSYVGYYSDPETFEAVGYLPFSRRPRFREEIRDRRRVPSLDVSPPAALGTDRLTADVVVIGSGAAGAVLAHEPVQRGRDVLVLDPEQSDLERLLAGLKLMGRIYLAAGAEKVMPSTFRYRTFEKPEELDQLDAIVLDSTDITLGTGHPQGGAAISADAQKGVVDPEFRVWGFKNLYCCDASVFPTSIGVNPQLTVMTLAKYASEMIQ